MFFVLYFARSHAENIFANVLAYIHKKIFLNDHLINNLNIVNRKTFTKHFKFLNFFGIVITL